MSKTYSGLPTACLLPLRNAEFKVVKELKITIPREGVYSELNGDLFPEDSGAFKLLDNDVFYIPAVTKILLAVNKYPELQSNQIFTPSVFVFDEDGVEIQGSVIEIIKVMQ